MEKHDPLTEKIIGCCFAVHNELGAGFNEKIYHKALLLSLKENSLACETEKQFRVKFKNEYVGSLKLDLIVNDKVVVEVKALAGNIPAVFNYQILSYLKISRLKTGLLVNFGNKSCQVKRFSL